MSSENMYHTTEEYAHVLAARLWFRVRSLKSIAKEWETREEFVQTIQESEEYRFAVEKLMRTSRSPGNLLKWIEREEHSGHIPSGLAERMGLPETVVSEMVARIKSEIDSRC